MKPEDLETVYDALAGQLDSVPAEKRELYLAKLALLQAEAAGDVKAALDMIGAAALNLDV